MPPLDTADYADTAHRKSAHADYVLPRKTLQLVDAGVFWPLQSRSALPTYRRLRLRRPGFRGRLPHVGHSERVDRRDGSEREVSRKTAGGAARRLPAARIHWDNGAMPSTPSPTLGWDEAWSSAFEPSRRRGPEPGSDRRAASRRVRRPDRHGRAAQPDHQPPSPGVGSHRRFLCVGDWVALDPSGSIIDVRPSGTTISRRAAHEPASGVSREQVIAANVDVVLVVHALGQEVDTPTVRALPRTRGREPCAAGRPAHEGRPRGGIRDEVDGGARGRRRRGSDYIVSARTGARARHHERCSAGRHDRSPVRPVRCGQVDPGQRADRRRLALALAAGAVGTGAELGDARPREASSHPASERRHTHRQPRHARAAPLDRRRHTR